MNHDHNYQMKLHERNQFYVLSTAIPRKKIRASNKYKKNIISEKNFHNNL